MNSIVNYILNMLPYMMVAVPFYLAIRFIIIKKREIKINPFHEIALFVFIIFLVGLASQTVIPKFEIDMSGKIAIVKTRIHETNLIPFKSVYVTYREVFENGNINYFIINFIGNLAVFMPVGFFIPLLWNISNKAVILTGFSASFFIEFCQLFLRRGTDVDDLILNTIGTLIGLILYKIINRFAESLCMKFKKSMDK